MNGKNRKKKMNPLVPPNDLHNISISNSLRTDPNPLLSPTMNNNELSNHTKSDRYVTTTPHSNYNEKKKSAVALNPNAEEFTLPPEVVRQHLQSMEGCYPQAQLVPIPLELYHLYQQMGVLPPQPFTPPITPMPIPPGNEYQEFHDSLRRHSRLIPRLGINANTALKTSSRCKRDTEYTNTAMPFPPPPPLPGGLCCGAMDDGGNTNTGTPLTPSQTPAGDGSIGGGSNSDHATTPIVQFPLTPLTPMSLFQPAPMVPMTSDPNELQRQLSDMEATMQEQLAMLDTIVGFKPDLTQSGPRPEKGGNGTTPECTPPCNANLHHDSK